jgi:hypothetical protein
MNEGCYYYYYYYYMTSSFLELACSTFLLQILRSNANVFRPSVPGGFLLTLATASVHVSFAFCTGRLPHIFSSSAIFDVLYPSILQMCLAVPALCV